ASALDGRRLLGICNSALGRPLSCLVLGTASTLGLAPHSMWPVTLLGLVLFMMLLAKAPTWKAAFLAAACWFGSYSASSLWWLNFVMEGFGGIPAPLSWLWVAACGAALSLHYALFTAIAHALSRGSRAALLAFLLPAAIAAADATVSLGPLGFPWMNLGNLAVSGPFKTYLPLVGARGTSLLFAMAAGSAALAALRQYPWLPIAGVIVAFGLVFSSVRYTEPSGEVKAVLVQGNVPQEVRWDPNMASRSLGTYWNLSRQSLREGVLVIWPEGSLPFYLSDAPQILADLDAAFGDAGATLVLGSLRRAEDGKHNSIFVLGRRGAGDPQHYDKRKLVPLGEFVPFENALRPLGRMFNIPMSDFVPPREDPHAISAGGVKFLPAICYEAIFPETVDGNDSDDAGAILMVSNDAWFGTTRGPLEHLDIARVRSMELQKPMLRVTSNGVTAVIGPDGSVLAQLPRDTAAVLEAKAVTMKGRTPYSRLGNLPLAAACAILLLGGILVSRRRARRDGLEELVRP
ncbi:MAG: apolipoprotein N-acyltransferase, partial [Succinivibrio sp.]